MDQTPRERAGRPQPRAGRAGPRGASRSQRHLRQPQDHQRAASPQDHREPQDRRQTHEKAGNPLESEQEVPRAYDRLGPRQPDRPQRARSELRVGCRTEPGLGRRHHLHSDRRGLLVSGRRDGPLQPQDRRLEVAAATRRISSSARSTRRFFPESLSWVFFITPTAACSTPAAATADSWRRAAWRRA